ncbi:3-hydroxyacyl-CoA dehydrogenase NAD-binding domain-containing protein, partial [Erwinia amylovora]|uniref:3-hydroxyacyl-CoA dehydrogenase NAD-binding domain-containing protein n=1 Tax=Erwinia amylovora TaxID=552 RepID=UPI0020C028F8
MQTIAVIGAGQMGSGIAQIAAASGKAVLLSDISLELAEAARAKIEKGLMKLAERGKIPAEDAVATVSRIIPVG